MTLIVSEITTSVFQTFRPNSNKLLGAVRPHLYIHNRPSGTIKVQILTSDETLIAESDAMNIQDITASDEYHGYVTFNVNAFLKKDVPFLVKVVCAGGYSFSELAYCGVCNDYDLRKYQPSTPIAHPKLAPLDFEFWTYSTK